VFLTNPRYEAGIPLSVVKALFRKLDIKLDETALGYTKLSSLFRDDKLAAVCRLEMRGPEHVIRRSNDPPGDQRASHNRRRQRQRPTVSQQAMSVGSPFLGPGHFPSNSTNDSVRVANQAGMRVPACKGLLPTTALAPVPGHVAVTPSVPAAASRFHSPVTVRKTFVDFQGSDSDPEERWTRAHSDPGPSQG